MSRQNEDSIELTRARVALYCDGEFECEVEADEWGWFKWDMRPGKWTFKLVPWVAEP